MDKVLIRTIATSGKGVGVIEENSHKRPVFIPYTVPSEEVEFEITKKHKQYYEGKLTKIVKESPNRRNPICEHFGSCSGCQLLHIANQSQLSYKQEMVEYLFRRRKLDVKKWLPPVYSNSYGYRIKARITFVSKDGVLEFGIRDLEGKVFEMKYCDLIHPNMLLLIKKLNEMKIKSSGFGHCEILTDPHKKTNHVSVFSNMKLEEIQTALLEINRKFPHLLLGFEMMMGRSLLFEIGDLDVNLDFKDFVIKTHPRAFVQANWPTQIELVKAATSGFENEDAILEMYSGIGTFSINLSKNCNQLLCVEQNDVSTTYAKDNFKANGIENASVWITPAGASLQKLRDLNFTHVFLDPPRAGCSESVLRSLNERKILRMTMVSCNPETLVKDLSFLTNYKINSVQLVDMFPNTRHVEVIVKLSKR